MWVVNERIAGEVRVDTNTEWMCPDTFFFFLVPSLLS